MILDEPKSALDPETERIVGQTLRQSLRGRTVIFITHRPALAEIADTVLSAQGWEDRFGDGTRVSECQPFRGHTGKGVRVAVINSGVHAMQPHIGGVEGGVTIAHEPDEKNYVDVNRARRGSDGGR